VDVYANAEIERSELDFDGHRRIGMKPFVWGLVAALAVSGCATKVVPPIPTLPPAKTVASTSAPTSLAVVPPAGTARTMRLATGPDLRALPITADAAQRALGAFRTSCPALLRRTDNSGLTRTADWQAACDAAKSATDARDFFRTQFETVQIGDGKAFATGYYEPEIAGSRTPVVDGEPVYAVPKDLVEVDLGKFSDALKGKKIRGRVDGQALVPYYERGEIEAGALAGRGLELAWAADPIAMFFLQVQGSGRLRMPDGSVMRIGYAGQNGRDYTGIGKLMKDRGLLAGRPTSMQGIIAWLRENPQEGRAIMRENKSFIFFRELTGTGPLGALNVPVIAQTSIAADPAFVPLGAPVFLSMDRAEPNGLWIAQDTGGAIKGANRFDTFWGAGAQAELIAGGMTARGTALLFLPKGTLARLAAEEATDGGATPQP
jgi:membrane-bound lytic murein transglycosylase A